MDRERHQPVRCPEALTVSGAQPSGLFSGTAWYYARFRPAYPDALFTRIIERFQLDGTGRLLDLGCGTGELLVPLAPHVASAIGMDPEPEMLAEAAARVRRVGLDNVRLIQGGSDDIETLRAQISDLRLVVMGRSFHWMDEMTTLRALHALLEPGGGLVVTGDGCGVWSGEERWQVAVREVIHRWLGERRRAGSGSYTIDHEPWETLFPRSPFARVEQLRIEWQREWEIDTIVGFLYSTSFCSIPVLGDLREPFEADLRATLAAFDGPLTEAGVLDVFMLRKG